MSEEKSVNKNQPVTKNLPAAIQQSRAPSVFSGISAFEDAQRMAKALCSSTLVPTDYQGQNGLSNAMIALEMAQRIGASPMAVMQNMHVIEGRPSWSSSFIIASLNSCGRFSPIRFEVEDLGEKDCSYEYWTGQKGNRTKATGSIKVNNRSCYAWAYDAGGEKLTGPPVSIEMAVAEGWYTKNGSKWKTMPELMLRYRAAAFFGRLYAPDVLMGMHADDEIQDIGARNITESAAPVLVTDVDGTGTGQQMQEVEGEATGDGSGEILPDIDGDQVVTPSGEPDREAIKDELVKLGVAFSERARTSTLEALLNDAIAEQNDSVETENAEDDSSDADAGAEDAGSADDKTPPPPLAGADKNNVQKNKGITLF